MADPDATQPAAARFRRPFVTACAVLLIVMIALGGWWWRFDLASHGLPYYGLTLCVTTPWLAWQQRWRMAGIAAAALAFCAWHVGPYFNPLPKPSYGQPFTVVVCNVLSGNETPQLAIDWLRAQQADAAVVLEVTPAWVPGLESLVDVYPHQRFQAREGNFGIAVLSRRPWVNAERVDFGSAVFPSFIVDYEIDGAPVRLIATHPPPPVSELRSQQRNRQLEMVGQACARAAGTCLVAGDLNATPWCYGFRRLTSNGNLRDSGLGCGIQPTWPILHGLSVIPIDHVLISNGVIVSHREVGPDVGSDHRPVHVELMIPSNRETASEIR